MSGRQPMSCLYGGCVATSYRGEWVCEVCGNPCDAPKVPLPPDPFHEMCLARERYLDALRAQSAGGKRLEIKHMLTMLTGEI